MKTKLFCSSTIVLIWLTAACGLVGRNAERSPAQNQQQPAAQPRGSDGGAPNTETAAAPPRVGTLFRGSIGDAKVEMDIKREGESLNGSYYYLKSGSSNRLTLKGKVAADGTFTMQESDTAGKQTGTFKGKWKQEPSEAGATLEGEWLKPGQASAVLRSESNCARDTDSTTLTLMAPVVALASLVALGNMHDGPSRVLPRFGGP